MKLPTNDPDDWTVKEAFSVIAIFGLYWVLTVLVINVVVYLLTE